MAVKDFINSKTALNYFQKYVLSFVFGTLLYFSSSQEFVYPFYIGGFVIIFGYYYLSQSLLESKYTYLIIIYSILLLDFFRILFIQSSFNVFCFNYLFFQFIGLMLFCAVIIDGKILGWLLLEKMNIIDNAPSSGTDELNREDGVLIGLVAFFQTYISFSDAIKTNNFTQLLALISMFTFVLLRSYAHIKNNNKYRYLSTCILFITIIFDISVFYFYNFILTNQIIIEYSKVIQFPITLFVYFILIIFAAVSSVILIMASKKRYLTQCDYY